MQGKEIVKNVEDAEVMLPIVKREICVLILKNHDLQENSGTVFWRTIEDRYCQLIISGICLNITSRNSIVV